MKDGVKEGAVPDLHERGRVREIEARKLGVLKGACADHRELGGDHEPAFKASGKEGAVPDLYPYKG